MRFLLSTALACLLSVSLGAQPEITSWVINFTEDVGFNNIPSNVQSVNYTDDDVYVSCTCIPGYDIGPWAGNPNTAENQDFCFKITRSPNQNTGNLIETPMGHIGVWKNGVSIFNAKDAFSYNNSGIWFQDAYVFEGPSFDDCLGHPAPNGEYHHHVNPTCLYNDSDTDNHSPIIGYAFDGFPIYGAYGYRNLDGAGAAVVMMKSSYQLRNIEVREVLPNGQPLDNAFHGPPVNSMYPLGSFLEDYEYIENSGTLDEHNGRYCVTPEYPNGTYAYFVTINEYLDPIFPYTIGPDYYGLVQFGNTGPQSGHNSIPLDAINYNPVNFIHQISGIGGNKSLIRILDALGREVNHTPNQILFHIYDDGSVEKKFMVE